MSSATRQAGKIQPRPWGRAAGLLAACLVTLAGVARGLSPEVILGRAAVSGLVIGVIAWAVAIYANHLNQRSE